MEDIILTARLSTGEIICVSPVHEKTYAEFVELDNLGGCTGYFISSQKGSEYEVLAKAASLDAARKIFRMLSAR